ncbi:hypothetical protein [Lichenibacterium dinghuense]|uniref:hypothetical protein n=1 Tax=Lichenibacterium dinghuense TaxID=2895977 RepID=UPI001F3C58D9|nr:hypothetical protein [Lichenibacterium sp. 6Y81]
MRARLIAAALMVLAGADAASAKMMSEKERMRAQAEHLCYNDVQTLCNADIPDETKIAACMKVHRARLSPGCRKVFDAGLK